MLCNEYLSPPFTFYLLACQGVALISVGNYCQIYICVVKNKTPVAVGKAHEQMYIYIYYYKLRKRKVMDGYLGKRTEKRYHHHSLFFQGKGCITIYFLN